MYMREMGTVELLTREGEIEIAKRIEGGLMDMMEAISASPATIAEILNMGEKSARARSSSTPWSMIFPTRGGRRLRGRGRLRREYDEEDDDDGKGGSKAMTRPAEKLKNDGVERLTCCARCSRRCTRSTTRRAGGTPAYMKAQHEISAELMTIRFTAKTIEKLCDMVRAQVDDAQEGARAAPHHRGDKCGMPQETFHQGVPPNLPGTCTSSGREQAAAASPEHPWGATSRRSRSCSSTDRPAVARGRAAG